MDLTCTKSHRIIIALKIQEKKFKQCKVVMFFGPNETLVQFYTFMNSSFISNSNVQKNLKEKHAGARN